MLEYMSVYETEIETWSAEDGLHTAEKSMIGRIVGVKAKTFY